MEEEFRWAMGKQNGLAKFALRGLCTAIVSGEKPDCRLVTVVGGRATGKTSALREIVRFLRSHKPNISIECTSAELFTRGMVDAIRKNSITSFRGALVERNEVFLLDDIHVMEGRARTQEEIVSFLDSIMTANRVAVFFSRFDLEELEAREFNTKLVDYLSSGLVVKLEAPTPETLIRVMEKCASEKGLEVPETWKEIVRANKRLNAYAVEGLFQAFSITDRYLRTLGLQLDLEKAIPFIKES